MKGVHPLEDMPLEEAIASAGYEQHTTIFDSLFPLVRIKNAYKAGDLTKERYHAILEQGLETALGILDSYFKYGLTPCARAKRDVAVLYARELGKEHEIQSAIDNFTKTFGIDLKHKQS